MQTELNGFEYFSKKPEGFVIFQNNYHYSRKRIFSYYDIEYKDEQNYYHDAIAKFTVKLKQQNPG